MSDERPKPKYGELAPPGWSWQPPAPPANDSDVPAPSGASGARGGGSAGSTPPESPPYGAPPQSYLPPREQPGAPGTWGTGADAPRPISTADVAVTGFLLFFGLLLSASMLPALFDFNTVLGQAAAVQGYTRFTPSSAASAAGIIAAVVTIALQLLAIVIGVRRLQRRRLAFPFVLGLGILTFIVWMVAIVFAYLNDPAFLQQFMSTDAP